MKYHEYRIEWGSLVVEARWHSTKVEKLESYGLGFEEIVAAFVDPNTRKRIMENPRNNPAYEGQKVLLLRIPPYACVLVPFKIREENGKILYRLLTAFPYNRGAYLLERD